jgi:hypothetical protein
MNGFSSEVLSVIGYYVYILIDPRNDEIFYVGHGAENRIFDHEDEIEYSEKNERIANIIETGHSVGKYVVHYGIKTKKEALAVETALYSFLLFQDSPLTNVQLPHNFKHVCSTVEELNAKYSGTQLTLNDFAGVGAFVLLNLNKYDNRKHWNLDDCRKQLNEFLFSQGNTPPLNAQVVAFAVSYGAIIYAFDVNNWSNEEAKWRRNTTHIIHRIDKANKNNALSKKYRFRSVASLVGYTATSKAWRIKTYFNNQ